MTRSGARDRSWYVGSNIVIEVVLKKLCLCYLCLCVDGAGVGRVRVADINTVRTLTSETVEIVLDCCFNELDCSLLRALGR